MHQLDDAWLEVSPSKKTIKLCAYYVGAKTSNWAVVSQKTVRYNPLKHYKTDESGHIGKIYNDPISYLVKIWSRRCTT